uniref:ATP-dependent RNA helicase HrpA n=1 Tax=Heterorhabditis bacteriophora TaxID=37862 RepID=A0A1I7XR44_HETBA
MANNIKTAAKNILYNAVPQKDPDEASTPQWRITVNPSAELFGSQRLRQLIDRLYHQQKLLTPQDAQQWRPELLVAKYTN